MPDNIIICSIKFHDDICQTPVHIKPSNTMELFTSVRANKKRYKTGVIASMLRTLNI